MYDLAETRHPHTGAATLEVMDTPKAFKAQSGQRTSTNNFYRNGGKRLLDLALVIAGGLLVLPVMLVIALMVRRDGGPAFYVQKRVGLDGREFNLWKFRSMVPDAEKKLAEYLASDPAAAKEWHVSQKLKKDPRITPVGRFIRKTSLDELPQLLNVLTGDMSLVGPRPMMPSQRDLYPGSEYYALRPGLTGLWQVSQRNETSFAGRAKYDATYYKTLSFSTDLRTLGRTFGVVVKGSGV